MKRFKAILGTVLIAAVFIISGSAVATMVYVEVYDWEDCTNIDEIEGINDGTYATIGVNGPPEKLGWVIVMLANSAVMGPSQDFTVFAGSIIAEDYSVYVGETEYFAFSMYVGDGVDTGNEVFYTPSTPGKLYPYIFIIGIYGERDPATDPIYGPDIDAVGFDL